MNSLNLKLLYEGAPIESLETKHRESIQQEFDKLQEREPINVGEILISTTGINFRENFIIVSFFIRNASEQNLYIKNIPVRVQYKEESQLEAFQLNSDLKIEALSAGAYKIMIDKTQYKEEILYATVDCKLSVREEGEKGEN